MHPSRKLIFIVCVLVLTRLATGVGVGPPEVEQRVREVTRLQVAAERDDATAAARSESLDSCIAARASLIETSEQDDRAPTWMLDQAEAILTRAGRDGAEMSAYFGLPTPEQRSRIQDAAAQASRLVKRADELASGIVKRLESSIFNADKQDAAAAKAAAAQAEATLAVLVDTEQAWRIPLLRARAAVLLAAVDTAPASAQARTKMLDMTIESLAKLGPPICRGEVDVTRRMLVGCAGLLRERESAGNLGADSDPARQFRFLVQDRGILHPSPKLARRMSVNAMQAACGIALCVRTAVEAMKAVRESFDFTTGQNAYGIARLPEMDLLVAESAARVFLLTRWVPGGGPDRSTPERDTAWITLALSRLIAVLDAPPVEVPREAWRAFVYEKMATVVEPTMPLDRLSPHVTYALALNCGEREVRPGEAAAAQDRRHAEAARLYRLVIEREDSGELRAEAMWELASLGIPSDPQAAARLGLAERLEVATMMLRLVKEYPTSPRRRSAIEAAVWATRISPPSSTPPEQLERLARLQQSSRELAVSLSLALTDDLLCRAELGELLAAQAIQGARATPPRTEVAALATRAVALLNEAATDASLSVRAKARTGELFEQLLDASVVSAMPPAERARFAEGAVDWATRQAPERVWEFKLSLAEAWQAVGDPRGATVYAELEAWLDPAQRERLPRAEQDVLRAQDARLRLGLGRSLRSVGETKKAFEMLRKLADDLDHEPAAAPVGVPLAPNRPDRLVRTDEFWGAWCELLEMLAADNPQGDRTATIRLQLNRLSLLDAGLGPEPMSSRLKKVQLSIR